MPLGMVERWLLGSVVLGPVVACAACLELDEGDTSGARGGLGCDAELTPHDVQGPGDVSPLDGERLGVTGVVALTSEHPGDPSGFFLQSLAADGLDQSSEGLFVSFPKPAPAPGTVVTVIGVVVEQAGETWLDAVERVEACGYAPLVPLAVGARELDALEPLEHTLIEAHADWTVLDVTPASLRDGSVVLSPHGRVFAPGHELGGSSPSEAGAVRSGAGVAPWRLEPARAETRVSPESLPRRGTRLPALGGVVRAPSGVPHLLAPAPPAWARAAPPPPVRPRPGGLRVAALNLHNYFIDRLGPGARSELELQRQRTKLAAALLALDADVLGLTELENVGSRSLEHLLEGLASAAPDEPPYHYAEEAPPSGSELRAGIAYRPDRVRPSGPAWFETAAGFRRAPLFQSFESAAGSLTIGVVHFKSKHCGDEPTLVPEEGCGEDTRRAEAELLLESLRRQRERRPLEPLLIVGDLNSDPLEAAVATLEQAGLVDLLGTLPSDERYSFVYEARASLLDHAFGSAELAARARGAAIWHINADEPAFRDYSLDNPPDAYVADARRSSDHDPIIVDLDL